jgi:hypothetical protein
MVRKALGCRKEDLKDTHTRGVCVSQAKVVWNCKYGEKMIGHRGCDCVYVASCSLLYCMVFPQGYLAWEVPIERISFVYLRIGQLNPPKGDLEICLRSPYDMKLSFSLIELNHIRGICNL